MSVYTKAADFLMMEIERYFLKNGTVSVALSGGNTPKYLYRELVSGYSDFGHWNDINFYFGDERAADADSEYNNYKTALKTFFEPLNIAEENVHRIPVGKESAEFCANEYSNIILKNNLADGFDIVILGMGPDSHVASIFPKNKDAIFTDRYYVSTPIPPREPLVGRITITMPFINRSGSIILVAEGPEKKKMFDRIISEGIRDDTEYPVSFLKTENTRFFVE